MPGDILATVLGILWALASAIGYGASDYSAGLAARAASVIRVTILGEAASILVLLLVVPWASTQWPSWPSVAWAAAAGLGGVIGAMTLYLGFRHAAFSVAGPLSAVASAGFSVLAGLLFGEHPSGLAVAGIALALPAIVAVSASPGGEFADGSRGHRAAGAAYGLAAGAGFAVLFIGLNRAGSGHDLWPLVISPAAGLTALCLVAAVSRQLKPPPRRAGWLRWPGRPAEPAPPATSSRPTTACSRSPRSSPRCIRRPRSCWPGCCSGSG